MEVLDIKREDWKAMHLFIGKESSGIRYLEGAVRCISYEDLSKTIDGVLKSKYKGPISPVLRALWSLLGPDVKLFKIA